jgi:transposase
MTDIDAGPASRPGNRDHGMPFRRDETDLSDEHRAMLSRRARAGTTPQRVALRCRIVLLAAQGQSPRQIAAALRVTVRTVTRWRERFMAGGPDALLRDAPGRGRRSVIPAAARARLFGLIEQGAPPDGRRWTVRALARASGLARSTVQRLLADRRRGEPAIPGRRR